MSRASELRQQRREAANTARRRAETHSSGFETTSLKLPDGLNFWNPKEGIYTVDIVPYKVGVGNPYAEPGDIHYERTYWRYNKVGANEKPYVCLAKTFNKPDPIAQWREKEARNPESADRVKAMAPKERQLFLVWDYKEKEKGVQLWEFSFHQFGKLLDDRIQQRGEKDWDQFWYTDCGGYTLRLTFKEEKPYGVPVIAIDFEPREDEYSMPDKVKNHGICLDDLLVEVPYEKLKSIFLMIAEDQEKNDAKIDTKSERKEEPPFEAEKVSEEKQLEEKPKRFPVASEFGLEKGDLVSYEGRTVSIMKISPDGTSLTLYDDTSDDVIKAVGPEEVKKAIQNGKPEMTQKQETASKTVSDEDEWDKDWA